MTLVMRYLVFFALMLGSVLHTHGQEVTFDAKVDRNRIAVGEHLRLTITLSNSRGSMTHPDLGGLVIVGGPFEGSAVNIVNGRMSSSTSHQWVLTATSPGTYTIGPAETRSGTTALRTNPITIEVSKATTRPSDPQASQGQRGDANLFATLTLSSRKAFVGEQVTATYTLYTRYSVLEQAGYELPKLDGFWAEEVEMGKAIWEQKMENINGLDYKVAVLKQQVLFPQRAGTLRIEPLKISFVVNRSWMSRGTRVDVASNAVELTVLPLPGSAPAGFNGAVGDLQLTVRAERTSVKADEAIDLIVKISGRSNLKLIDAPKLELPTDLETYDPKVVDKITVNAGGMSGSREFQYLIIPRHEGTYTLEGIPFSFFDTKSGTYRTLKSQPITIDVSPGDGIGGALVQRSRRRDVQMLEEDIRYIRTGDLELQERGKYLFASLPWIAGMGTPCIAFILLLVWQRHRDRSEADQLGTRRKRADKVAKQRLRLAEDAIKNDDRDGFYGALSRALNGYVADRSGTGVSTLDRHALKAYFEALPEGDEVGGTYERLMASCDMARFAPGDERPRKDLYEEAVALITRMERYVRT